jgi:hypothetical protein
MNLTVCLRAATNSDGYDGLAVHRLRPLDDGKSNRPTPPSGLSTG